MKVLIGSLIVLSSLHAFATEDLATMKDTMTQSLDQRIANLQAAKSCVASATTPAALKACHQDLKSKQKSELERMKGLREQWKANRKAIKGQ